MASKFAQGENCLFPHRQAAIDFLDSMLAHKLFHRARKVPVTEQELRGRKKKEENESKEVTGDEVKASKKKDNTDAESSHAEGKPEVKQEPKEKRKRKIRLDMHPEQLVVDGHEAYVWIYDPIPWHYWVLGILVVAAAVLVCLFPLWPPELRKAVYYLSIAAAGFLVFILGLVILRAVTFALIWLFTGGKHHFWIFPNLTEDVGFFASFRPIYCHEYRGGKDSKKKDKKKRKKDKDSDAEEEQTLLEEQEPETLDHVEDVNDEEEKR